jgi:hypothetical protein
MSVVRLAAWTVAAAVAIGGCSNGNRDSTAGANAGSKAASGTTPDPNNPLVLTVTGCLQRAEGGNDFILAQASAQPAPVATGGTTESGAAQRQQEQPASGSYRLSGGPDELRDWVGHQVRVTGAVEARGDRQSPGANQAGGRMDPVRLEVTAAESVAATCGASRY